MKHSPVLLIILSILLYPPELIAQKKLTILHTNDMHSCLLGNGPGDDNPTGQGGFSRLGSEIKQQKAMADHAVIVVDAGDFLMGTLFQMLEVETGFQLNLMHQMGYDAVSLGNHEFDFGLANLKKYLMKAHELGSPPVILSNIAPDDELAELYADSIVKTYQILEVDGIRIGLFGLLGENAYEYSPNLKDYTYLDRVKTAKKMVQILREKEKADFVICLSHSGVYQDKKGNWDPKREDIELAGKVSGLDVIISGHTHTKLSEPLVINGTPVVQALTKGMYLGKTTLVKGAPEQLEYTLIPIDETVRADPYFDSLIGKQLVKLKEDLKEKAGLEYDKIYFESEFALTHADDVPEETSIGNFIADAMYYTVNQFDSAGTDIAMIAQGMIRCGLAPGQQTLPSVFQVASLGEGNDQMPGYPLSRLYFTPHEIKLVLELLHLVAEKDPGYHCFAGGIQIVYQEKGGFLKKIREIRIREGDSWQTLDCSRKNHRLYSVTADAYMMQFLTVLKKKSFGLVNVKPKLENGEAVTDFSATIVDMDAKAPGIQEGKVWSSMLKYASSFKDSDGNGIPEVPDKYGPSVP